MSEPCEIYFDDLTDAAKQRVLELYGMSNAEDGNFDISPLFVLEYEEEDAPSWVDRHSVNCIRCNVLFDERKGITPEDGEGTLCPECIEYGGQNAHS